MISPALPDHARLREALVAALEDNGGLGNPSWAVVVDRDGVVRTVAYSALGRGGQWPGSRLIAAAKASTANGFSLDSFALSTANVYAGAQPGGLLYGIAEGNPINLGVAYAGDPETFGSPNDPLIGKAPGGTITFAGGLALYDAAGNCVGGLGVSGDLSCSDHNAAWKLRHALELDYVPAGVSPSVSKGLDDNIIYDLDAKTAASASGWGHPTCLPTTTKVGKSLSKRYPVRKVGR